MIVFNKSKSFLACFSDLKVLVRNRVIAENVLDGVS